MLKWFPMTFDDLGDHLFANVPKAAAVLGLDPRTVRRAAAAGDIPACRIGAKWLIPLTWLQEQAGATADLEAFIDSRVQGPAS